MLDALGPGHYIPELQKATNNEAPKWSMYGRLGGAKVVASLSELGPGSCGMDYSAFGGQVDATKPTAGRSRFGGRDSSHADVLDMGQILAQDKLHDKQMKPIKVRGGAGSRWCVEEGSAVNGMGGGNKLEQAHSRLVCPVVLCARMCMCVEAGHSTPAKSGSDRQGLAWARNLQGEVIHPHCHRQVRQQQKPAGCSAAHASEETVSIAVLRARSVTDNNRRDVTDR